MPHLFCEVCVDSLAGALAAMEGGADRLELCGPLSLGGITPSLGLVRAVRAHCPLPLMVMIRPHDRDFCYSELELDVMLRDIQALRDEGIAGFVFGALTPDGRIDRSATERLVAASQPFETTFHRAFDEVGDQPAALESLIDLGITRILTSGGVSSAADAVEPLRRLVDQAGPRLIVMPGGGLDEANIAAVRKGTAARELHFSARVDPPAQSAASVRFSAPILPRKITSAAKVRRLRAAADIQAP